MSLKSALVICLVGGFTLLAACVFYTLTQFVEHVTRAEIESTVATRTTSVAQDLDRTLNGDWQELGILGRTIPNQKVDTARAYLDGVASSTRVAWVGLIGIDGIVRAASSGTLEGQDVSAHSWFAAGLAGGFAGDVGSILSEQSAPPYVLGMAVPAINDEGQTVGVVAMHLGADWLQGYLAEMAAINRLDVILVAADGSMAGSSLTEGSVDLANVGTLRAAAIGAPVVMSENWPDGVSYMSAVISQITHDGMPNLGWRIVGRVPSEASVIPRELLIGQVGAIALAAAMIFIIVGMAYTVFFVRPMSHLVDIAERVSHGEAVFPPMTRSTRETNRLASAIARWQSTRTITALNTHHESGQSVLNWPAKPANTAPLIRTKFPRLGETAR